MSYKINNDEIVVVIDSEELYEEVKSKQLEFYKWPRWIKRKIKRLNRDFISKKQNKELRKTLQVKKDIVAKHYFSKSNIDLDYFYGDI